MQTCSICNALSPDTVTECVNCHADLREFSTTAQALARFRNNPRVRHIIVSTFNDACPACQELQGAYPKNEAPRLPVEGCSHKDGCRCFYQPVLNEIVP